MLKRVFDIFFSIVCITLLSPLCILLAILIRLESSGPIFFIQERVGKSEKPFRIIKFRSMHTHHFTPEELGPIKHNHAVVTRVGYWLRRTKLDEIPQFFNVLWGDMSVVGPRPCLLSTAEQMTAQEKHRFLDRPGVTGWAEVTGNVELSWHEQLLLDLWYVDHQTFFLDMQIILRTILTVLFGSIRNDKALEQAKRYLNLREENT